MKDLSTFRVTASDGVALHAAACGAGAPVVFVHEFSGSSGSWDAQTSFFARYWRCVVYNARGYPPSQVPTGAGEYSQDRAADDVADVVRAVADGPAHVVGLSMGAFAALHFALRHPTLAKSLVVAGCGYGAKPEQQPAYGERMREEAEHLDAIGMASYAAELADSGYASPLRAKDPFGWKHFAELLHAHSATGMAMTLRSVLATRPSLWHLEPELKQLRQPVLLVVGDEDAPCIEPTLYLKGALTQSGMAMLPRTGHLANLEEPDLFNGLVFRFLTAVEQGRWHGWNGRVNGD